MMVKMNFYAVEQLQQLQQLASLVDEDVFLHSLDSEIRVDAKSFIGLFTLDFSKPVNVVTESSYVVRKLEQMRVGQKKALVG